MISAIVLSAAIAAADLSSPFDGASANFDRTSRAVREVGLRLFGSDGRHRRQSECDTHLQEVAMKVIDFNTVKTQCTGWLDKIGDQTSAAYLCEDKCAAPLLQVFKAWSADTEVLTKCKKGDFGDVDPTAFKAFDDLFKLVVCAKNNLNGKYCYNGMQELGNMDKADSMASEDACKGLADLGCCMYTVLKGIPMNADLSQYFKSEGISWPTEDVDAIATEWKNQCRDLGADNNELDKMFFPQVCSVASVGDGIAASTLPYTDLDGTVHNGGGPTTTTTTAPSDSATDVAAGLTAAVLTVFSQLL